MDLTACGAYTLHDNSCYICVNGDVATLLETAPATLEDVEYTGKFTNGGEFQCNIPHIVRYQWNVKMWDTLYRDYHVYYSMTG